MGGLTSQQTEVTVYFTLLVLMLALAVYATRWRRSRDPHTLEEWGVGGRAFGNWVTWFLIGGASYTAATLVAVPSLTWAQGATGFYALPFALITAPLVFLVSPRMWSISHAHGFLTYPEFVRARFGSRTTALLVAVISIVATMPYIALQLSILQAVFKVVGLTGEAPLLVALGLLSLTTFRGGLRAPALLSIAKDVLLVWLILSTILVVAMSGGWAPAFKVSQLRFDQDTSPASGLLLSGPGQIAYLTLAVGSGLSIYAYPHALTGILAAKDRATIRRNAGALPIYVIAIGLLAMLGFFAIEKNVLPVGFVSGQAAGDLNTIIPNMFHQLFPAWCAGLAYATLTVAALIPSAIMSISAANVFTRAIWVPFVRPYASAREEARVSQWASLFMKFGAAAVLLLLPAHFSTDFQLIGSVIVLQTLPAVFLGLMTGWFHRGALILGMIAGLGFATYMLYETPQYTPDLTAVVRAHFGGSLWPVAKWGIHSDAQVYIGLIALALNLVIVVVGTLALRALRVPKGIDLTRPEQYTADADDPSLDRLEALLDGPPLEAGAHAVRHRGPGSNTVQLRR
jgi:SSS family solute:Na+ symporter